MQGFICKIGFLFFYKNVKIRKERKRKKLYNKEKLILVFFFLQYDEICLFLKVYVCYLFILISVLIVFKILICFGDNVLILF